MPTHNMTPYVTPHILHKHYAQSFDNEAVSKRTPSRPFTSQPHLIVYMQLLAATLSTSPRRALIWRRSPSNATRQLPCCTRTPSAMRAPSSPPLALSSTSLE